MPNLADIHRAKNPGQRTIAKSRKLQVAEWVEEGTRSASELRKLIQETWGYSDVYAGKMLTEARLLIAARLDKTERSEIIAEIYSRYDYLYVRAIREPNINAALGALAGMRQLLSLDIGTLQRMHRNS